MILRRQRLRSVRAGRPGPNTESFSVWRRVRAKRPVAALIVVLFGVFPVLVGSAPRVGAAVGHGGALSNIFRIEVNGGKLLQLTHNRSSQDDVLAFDPSLARDGDLLVFSQVDCHACDSKIRVIRLSKPHLRPVELAPGFHPRFSPDGRRIAYVTFDGAIGIMAANGSHRRRLPKQGLAEDTPAWSPDGRTIAFSVQLTGSTWQIAVSDLNGHRLRALTSAAGQALDPAWSPDGQRIVFARRESTGLFQLWVMKRDGSQARRIDDRKTNDSSPAWSPDGRRIAFIRDVGAGGPKLYVMPATGGPGRRVSPSSLDAFEPEWTADSHAILFAGRLPQH